MRRILITLICVSLLALALVGAWAFVRTAPKAERQRPPKMAALVDVQPLTKTNETVVLALTGVVGPAQDVMLRARVGGEIVAIAPGFVDGGSLARGAPVFPAIHSVQENLSPSSVLIRPAKVSEISD